MFLSAHVSFFVNLLSTCYQLYQLFINFLSTCYQLFINFYQLFINFINFLSTVYQCYQLFISVINFLSTLSTFEWPLISCLITLIELMNAHCLSPVCAECLAFKGATAALNGCCNHQGLWLHLEGQTVHFRWWN